MAYHYWNNPSFLPYESFRIGFNLMGGLVVLTKEELARN